ncbi:hypothetical protein KSP40_PGU018696 [Platanthera guangdongensis]|uniref:Uncharacterized protein n=1 Tax=Platanthera guangdongensis TaxID=2320717 RepID=A0ABR2MVL8_9ASPA
MYTKRRETLLRDRKRAWLVPRALPALPWQPSTIQEKLSLSPSHFFFRGLLPLRQVLHPKTSNDTLAIDFYTFGMLLGDWRRPQGETQGLAVKIGKNGTEKSRELEEITNQHIYRRIRILTCAQVGALPVVVHEGKVPYSCKKKSGLAGKISGYYRFWIINYITLYLDKTWDLSGNNSSPSEENICYFNVRDMYPGLTDESFNTTQTVILGVAPTKGRFTVMTTARNRSDLSVAPALIE